MTIEIIPLDLIEEPTIDIRIDIEEEEIRELAQSIKQVGLINPITVRQKGKNYEIIAGHKRYLAFQWLGRPAIPSIVINKSDIESEAIKLHENLCRKDISPIEEARAFKLLQEKYQLNLKEIAKITGFSEAYISQRLSILDASEEVKDALQRGDINFSQAREIASAPSEIQPKLTEIAVEHGASPESIRIMKSDLTKAQEAMEKAIEKAEEDKENTNVKVSLLERKTLFKCPGCLEFYPLERMNPINLCIECYNRMSEVLER